MTDYIKTTTGKDGKEYYNVFLSKLPQYYKDEPACEPSIVFELGFEAPKERALPWGTRHSYKLLDEANTPIYMDLTGTERMTTFGILLHDVLKIKPKGFRFQIRRVLTKTPKSPKGYFVNYELVEPTN